jgi:hypothetical protein
MTDQNKESFRVLDKRRFSDSGQETESKETELKDNAESSVPPTSTGKPDSEANRQPEEAITYSSFVFSLGMQGLVMMGEGGVPGVADGQFEINLAAARETIDLLSLLKEKTKGNLSPEEEKLTEEILSSLRMTYVKKTK